MLYKVTANQPITFSILVEAENMDQAIRKVESNEYDNSDAVEIDQGDWSVTNVEEVG